MKKTQQLYRVKINTAIVREDCQKDGYLAVNGRIADYSRGEAIKKARAFDGKIEKSTAKKYTIAELKIAQISAKKIDKQILIDLEESASFRDTDNELKEFLVSVDVLPTLSAEYAQTNKKALCELVDALYEQVSEYAYIQILKI